MPDSFLSHLMNVACGIPSIYTNPSNIPHPDKYLIVVLYNLSIHKITNNGLDNMLDILLGHNDFIPLLRQSAKYQESAIVPASLTDQWRYVILPAWDQYAYIRRIIDEVSPVRNNEWI